MWFISGFVVKIKSILKSDMLKKYSWQKLGLIDPCTLAIYDMLYNEGMGADQPL